MTRSHTVGGGILLNRVFVGLLCAGHGAEAQDRRLVEVQWHEAGGIEPAIESELLNPVHVAADASRLVIYDFGDHRVKAFDHQGTLLWTVGNYGKGPGEFTNPTDLQLDISGNAWVVDPANARITRVSAAGEVDRVVGLPDSRRIVRALPLAGGQAFWVLYADPTVLFGLIDSSGTTLHEVPAPVSLSAIEPIVRQANIASTGIGGIGVCVLSRSDYILVFNMLTGAIAVHRGVEKVDPPLAEGHVAPGGVTIRRVPRDAPAGARSVSPSGARIYVLFGGRSPLRYRLLDTYDARSGSYEGSLVLPEPARRALVVGSVVIALVASPSPGIQIWRAAPDQLRQ